MSAQNPQKYENKAADMAKIAREEAQRRAAKAAKK